MLESIVRRLIQTVIVLLIVSLIVFSIIHLTPGDPVVVMLGEDGSEEEKALLREQLGLNEPLWKQYLLWMANVLQGNLGDSISYKESVLGLIGDRVPITFHIGITALLAAVVLGIPLGILCAVRRGGVFDSIIAVITNISMAAPIFWLGVIGIYVFALKLGWLPVLGYEPLSAGLWDSTKTIIMPAFCLMVGPLASFARQTRSSMLEVIRQDYIRTARSKGLKESIIIVKHALKNAIIPVVTLIGLQLRNLVGGAALVETVFNVPGMGRLLVTGIFNRDYPLVQGTILVIAAFVAICNLLVDISYSYFDPRIRNK